MDDEIEAAVVGLSPDVAEIMRVMMRVRPQDWSEVRVFRDRLVHLHEVHPNESDRVAILFAFNAMMDGVMASETILDTDGKAKLADLRTTDYRLMLSREAMNNDGIIIPDVLEAITAREIEAGRLAPGDDFRQFAVVGAQVFGNLGSKAKKGFVSRLFQSKAS